MVRTRDQRSTNKCYYARNRPNEIARVRARQDENVALLRELRRVPCVDCGRTFQPFQMDFDHRNPATKSFRLTSPTGLGSSRERLLTEASKCDIVCACCHQIRTRDQHQERLRTRKSSGVSHGLDERRRRWRDHARVLNELRNVPCDDCGETLPPCAMDFDHPRAPTSRSASLEWLAGLGSRPSLPKPRSAISCVRTATERGRFVGARAHLERE